MRILMVGDTVGKPGRRILANHLKKFREERNIDFVVCNAENAAGGSGVTTAIARKMFKYGVDVATSGDHIIKKDFNKDTLNTFNRVLRPANYPDHWGGAGQIIVEHAPQGQKPVRIGILNLIGKVFIQDESFCPFESFDRFHAEFANHCDIILVDFHAEATSEKIAMGWHVDGRATAVVGSHTHIPTADETILPKGTAYITDLGMVGPYHSVIGRRVEDVLANFVRKEMTRFCVADGDVRMCGVIIDTDPATGKATAIERVNFREPNPPQPSEGEEEHDSED